MSTQVRQQIINDQIEGGVCKSAPILRQVNSSSAQDLHCKLSAPDESQVHKKAHSVDDGDTFSNTGKVATVQNIVIYIYRLLKITKPE